MSEYKYGELSDWNEAKPNNLSEYMRLAQGDNRVRIFTLPYQFHVCWIKDATGASRKLRSALKDCPLIKRGEKVQTRWLLGVINRDSKSAEILEIGSQILNGLKQLINEPGYGDPRGYDVNIKRGKKGDNPLYYVIAAPPSPLSDSDNKLIAEFSESTDLKKLTVPPTSEEVSQKLAELEGTQMTQASFGGSTSAPTSKPPINDSTFNFDDDEL